MVQQRACAIGVDQVMSFYDDVAEKYPFFSVWYNTNDKFIQSLTNDGPESREFLYTSLQALERSGDNAQYYLKIHPVYEQIYTRKAGEVISVPFRANPYEAGSGASVNGMNPYPRYSQDSAIMAKLEALEKRFDDLENEEPVEVEEKDMMGRIAGILEHPTLGPAIGNILSAILPKIISAFPGLATAVPQQNAMTSVNYQPAINGLNDTMTEEEKDEKINQALDRLEPLCDLATDLTLLANMAEKNPPMFNMMLATLRAQK